MGIACQFFLWCVWGPPRKKNPRHFEHSTWCAALIEPDEKKWMKKLKLWQALGRISEAVDAYKRGLKYESTNEDLKVPRVLECSYGLSTYGLDSYGVYSYGQDPNFTRVAGSAAAQCCIL